MTIWFSSDWHFGHANIIKFCNRPFADTKEMDESLVEWHNAYVKPNDHFYNLGDVTMSRDGQGKGLEIVKRLNGHGRLIMGNHDHYAIKHYAAVFEKVMAMQMFDGIRFTHIPIHPGSMGMTVANVHGHIHDAKSPDPVLDGTKVRPYVNVCVEWTGYRPVSLEEVKDMVKKAKEGYEPPAPTLESLNGC